VAGVESAELTASWATSSRAWYRPGGKRSPAAGDEEASRMSLACVSSHLAAARIDGAGGLGVTETLRAEQF